MVRIRKTFFFLKICTFQLTVDWHLDVSYSCVHICRPRQCRRCNSLRRSTKAWRFAKFGSYARSVQFERPSRTYHEALLFWILVGRTFDSTWSILEKLSQGRARGRIVPDGATDYRCTCLWTRKWPIVTNQLGTLRVISAVYGKVCIPHCIRHWLVERHSLRYMIGMIEAAVSRTQS